MLANSGLQKLRYIFYLANSDTIQSNPIFNTYELTKSHLHCQHLIYGIEVADYFLLKLRWIMSFTHVDVVQ